jgi:hypothetical protein
MIVLSACASGAPHPQAAGPNPAPALALDERGGLWEGRYIPTEGIFVRPETFMLAARGRFAWLQSANLNDEDVTAMNGVGFLRTGSWHLEGGVLVITENWRQHFDEATSIEDKAPITPPRTRRLAIGTCSPAAFDRTRAPAGTPCVTIAGVPFIRAGDAKAAGAEIDYLLDPSAATDDVPNK